MTTAGLVHGGRPGGGPGAGLPPAALLRNHGVASRRGGRPLGGAHRGHPGACRPVPVHRPHARPARPSRRGAAICSTAEYQDRFLDEYWAAWVRRARRARQSRRADDARPINGRPGTDVVPQELLLDVLRDRLDLTGAKRSCDVQVCGTCTVLVDDLPVSACTYLAVETDGRDVLTIEGLREARSSRPSATPSGGTRRCSAASARPPWRSPSTRCCRGTGGDRTRPPRPWAATCAAAPAIGPSSMRRASSRRPSHDHRGRRAGGSSVGHAPGGTDDKLRGDAPTWAT